MDSTGTALDNFVLTVVGSRDAKKIMEEHHELLRDFISNPFHVILRNACRCGLESMVLEKDYLDVDFRDDYQRSYSSSFNPPATRCSRLHLFSGVVDEECLLNPQMTDYLNSKFIGYVTARPTPNHPIGKSLLQPALKEHREYLVARAEYQCHILGHRLVIETVPFIQQDENTFVCAGAALWVASLHHHMKFGTPRYFPSQITQIARRFAPEQGVRTGLTNSHVCSALGAMGMQPNACAWSLLGKDGNPLSDERRLKILRAAKEILYVYVESGLTPILGFSTGKSGGHAVTVVGHDYDVSKVPSEYGLNSDYIQNFIVQDDAKGPFRRCSLDPPQEKFDSDKNLFTDARWLTIACPMPSLVNLQYHIQKASNSNDVKRKIGEMVSHSRAINSYITSYLRATDYPDLAEDYQFFPDDARFKTLVRRCSLMKGVNFKSRLWRTGGHEEINRYICSRHFAEWVWVVEFSDHDHLSREKEQEREICGRIIIDATAYPHAFLEGVLVYQYKNFIFDFTGENETFCVIGDKEWLTHEHKMS